MLWSDGSINSKLLDIVRLFIRFVIYCVRLQCPLVLLILVEVMIPLRTWIMAIKAWLLKKAKAVIVVVVFAVGLIIHLLIDLNRLGLLLHRVLYGI